MIVPRSLFMSSQVNDCAVPLTAQQLNLLVKAIFAYNDVDDYIEPYEISSLIQLRDIVKSWKPGLVSSDMGTESSLSEFGHDEVPLG
jgi:hypothetical protein